VQPKPFDDLADLKPLEGASDGNVQFASKVSAETEEALRKIDANIREAEQKSGMLLVA
jgi:hypothetical protein